MAQKLADEEAELLAIGFASLIHTHSPRSIILGGGMSQTFDQLAPGVRATLATHGQPGFGDVDLCRASLGTTALIFRPDFAALRPT